LIYIELSSGHYKSLSAELA